MRRDLALVVALAVARAVIALAVTMASLGVLSLMGCCRVGAGSIDAERLEEERASRVASAGPGYTGKVVRPFVLVVKGPPALREDAEQTVTWARDRLRADFFDHEPGKPLTIWIFPDEETYMRETSAVLGTIPETPYGFYRPCKRSLIVNAGSGWGTLVHELVHAYIDADFPGAPTWINEGLASLFEATEDRDGHIRGTTNWRLSHLQKAIRDHNAPSFEKLTSGSRGDFDGKEGYLYYAASRYLLYWLQEEGLLRDFYRAYRARAKDDETGLVVLRDVTKRDTSATRRAWETFVLGLRYQRQPP